MCYLLPVSGQLCIFSGQIGNFIKVAFKGRIENTFDKWWLSASADTSYNVEHIEWELGIYASEVIHTASF